MNKQQRILLIALGVLLALVLLLIVILDSSRRAGGVVDQPASAIQTLAPAPAPTAVATQPPSEEELGRQALLEEVDAPVDALDDLPID